MSAFGPSVWAFGVRQGGPGRTALFQSSDAGATWRDSPLPPRLRDVTHLERLSVLEAYVATSARADAPAFWHTSDAGATWAPLPTPRDQGVHSVPSYGVRIEAIARVGDWLVVREYGRMFVSPASSINWQALKGISYAVADSARQQLFALTDSLEARMMDRNLIVLWTSHSRILDAKPTNIEKVLARDGVGFVSMSSGDVYEARAGVLELVRPRAGSVPP